MKRYFLTLVIFIIGFACGYSQDEQFKLGLKYANAGKIDEAIQILSHDIAENPTAERYLALGIIYLQKGDYELAMQNLQEVVIREPQSQPARYALAMLYEKKKMYGESIEEWKKFLALTNDKELKRLARRHIRQLELIKNE